MWLLFLHVPSFWLGAGGFRVAQLVRIALLPIHCPLIPAIAFSASCKTKEKSVKNNANNRENNAISKDNENNRENNAISKDNDNKE